MQEPNEADGNAADGRGSSPASSVLGNVSRRELLKAGTSVAAVGALGAETT
jgi:hypothetical protein